MSIKVDYTNGDDKVSMVLADDANVEEVLNTLTKLTSKKKKEVKEETSAEPQILME